MHQQQQAFCKSIKHRFPDYFSEVFVLDFGSLDINGNNHALFDDTCTYLGVDLATGRNVDIVSPAHTLQLPDASIDVVISTECFEHDRHWPQTLHNAIRLLRPGGLLLLTCATTGRPEHGTRRAMPEDAPLLGLAAPDWADYYRNLTEDDIRAALDIERTFRTCAFAVNPHSHDLYFWGIKHGEFRNASTRSALLDTHPARRASAQLKLRIEEQQHQIERLTARLHVTETRLAGQLEECARLHASLSWRVTQPARAVMRQARHAARLAASARRAFGYVLRGDLTGLRDRLRCVQRERSQLGVARSGPPRHWGILSTRHTLFIAHLMAESLRAHGWTVDILTEAPDTFEHDMVIVICPQMFKRLPRSERCIVYQMEQSVSSRWFTPDYLRRLDNSLAVLEYSLVNVAYLAENDIAYPHVIYLPVGASTGYFPELCAQPAEKQWDVLFYGDSKSSPRRRRLIGALRRRFTVRTRDNLFGEEMAREIRAARLVINLHYYENALLEMPRIQECLSLGVPVVSERAQDQDDYPECQGAVTFFAHDDEGAMIAAVRDMLARPDSDARVAEAVRLGAARFRFMFDRFLVSMRFLGPDALQSVDLPLPGQAGRIALSMPETIQRRRLFEASRPAQCVVFDGVRRSPGWIGCGLSYQRLAQHARQHDLPRLTILEDDALLPPDFEERMRIVHAFLDAREGQWDIFAGVIASLHPGAQVLHVEDFRGMRFVTIDRMTSTVCNVYSPRALDLLSQWDPTFEDDQSNTIDRFIERQAGLRVIVTLPFAVGHREEVHSTLWGFQNTRYLEMIDASQSRLAELVEHYLDAAPISNAA
ncbi:MAG: hypothetical protein GAK40_00381 [Burkholderia plantarii]|nr:MAG: hypothetical protein GAK40_00381 [Burkholderia plantarii]